MSNEQNQTAEGGPLQRRVSQRTETLHAEGLVEHALCGMAFDAFQSGDADEPIKFAAAGQRVTCEACRRHIDFVRRAYKGYTYAG